MSALSAPAAAGVSIREFARREAVSEKLVRRAITNGFLQPLNSGLLDPVHVGTGWCERNRKRAGGAGEGADTSADTGADTPPPVRTEVSAPGVRIDLEEQGHGGALRRPRREPVSTEEPVDHQVALDMVRGGRATLAEAERIKANALAVKQLLESERQAGQLIEISVAESVLFAAARAARDGWLNWPARIGPLVAAELGLDADRVTEVLTPHVQQHLEDLGQPEFLVAADPD